MLFELILQQFNLGNSRFYAANMILTIEKVKYGWNFKNSRNIHRKEDLMTAEIEAHKDFIEKDVSDKTNFLYFALSHFNQLNNKKFITKERIATILNHWNEIYEYINISSNNSQRFINFVTSSSFLSCDSKGNSCNKLLEFWINNERGQSSGSESNIDGEGIMDDDFLFQDSFDAAFIDNW